MPSWRAVKEMPERATRIPFMMLKVGRFTIFSSLVSSHLSVTFRTPLDAVLVQSKRIFKRDRRPHATQL